MWPIASLSLFWEGKITVEEIKVRFENQQGKLICRTINGLLQLALDLFTFSV